MLDGTGQVVGMSVAGLMSPVDRSEGLNFFIPIADILEKLKIDLAVKP
jgi:S1-C subfamily serine protease